MSGHTPGPWAAELGEAYNVRAPHGGIVSQIHHLRGRYGLAGRIDGDEAAANARLIAAAPDGLDAGRELLGVVKAAIASGDWKVDGACDPDMAIRRMEAFIAKATGADA